MPLVFREAGFRFHFYSSEGDPREPPHVHVAKLRGDAKFWLDPQVRLAGNRGLTRSELRSVSKIAIDRRDELCAAWNDFFAGTD